MSTITSKIGQLTNDEIKLLCGIRRGIEKEGLRVDSNADLSLKAHPKMLGSALTHLLITTDFSEALLEFVTQPHSSIVNVLSQLHQIHAYTAKHINGESIWATSMPCRLGVDNDIPIATYGDSNLGKMKSLYRTGLSYRYGRSMQIVAGIHFNYSVPDTLWKHWHQVDGGSLSLTDYKSKNYFSLMRNFKRWYWLLIYLMGASPMVDVSFLSGKKHQLKQFHDDEDTYYLPHGTSLRLGTLGYQSAVQDAFPISYNSLGEYLKDLSVALHTEYPDYKRIGLRDHELAYKQISTAILQIENEYYSVIRPKQNITAEESQFIALKRRGVEYIEIRCLDVNPFHLMGIDDTQIRFIEVFLLTCLVEDSPLLSEEENATILHNQKLIVNCGRQAELQLSRYIGDEHRDITRLQWSLETHATHATGG